MSKSSESSVALLVSVIKQLSSGNLQQREFEKEKLQDNLRKADESLGYLVEDNQDNLKRTIQSFAIISSRVQGCRSKVTSLREKLTTCKTLLNCNREDLRRHWQEGLEYSEILSLLDKVDKAISVPDQLDKYVARKHYLHAAQLLVSTTSTVENTLSNVDALRELKSDLNSRKTMMHEMLIEELSKHIYSDVKPKKKKQSSDMSIASSTTRKHLTSTSKSSKLDTFSDGQIDQSKELMIAEDLQADPEEDITLFINILIESLDVLGKVSVAIDTIQKRIKREMALVIHRATDLVANKAIERGDGVTLENLSVIPQVLSKKENPTLLLELLEVVFDKFHCIAQNHEIVIDAVHRLKERSKMKGCEPSMAPDFAVYDLEQDKDNDEFRLSECSDYQMYTKEEIWSEIEFQVQVLLGYYLDIESRTARQQTISPFPNSENEISSFFVSKKKAKPSKYPLFRFEGSSSAIAMSSYIKDQGQDLISSIPGDTYADSLFSSKPQLLCKPNGSNITALFIPVISFIGEIEKKTSSTLGSKGVLYNFLTDFVKKVFLDHMFFAVTEKTRSTSREYIVADGGLRLDALKNLIDQATQNALTVKRPLLKATVSIVNAIEELSSIMKSMPVYTNDFLDIIAQILHEYLATCRESYKSLVLREEAGKPSNIFSASWAKDEDINRYLKTLPNWLNLQEELAKGKKITRDEDKESIRARNSQQAEKLLGMLKKGAIAKNEVILDIGDLKSLINLQESIDWLIKRVRDFTVRLSANTTSIKVQDPDTLEGLMDLIAQLPPIPEDTLRSLDKLTEEFQELADTCLLVLHLEIQSHCLYYLIPATRQSNYVCTMDAVEVDPLVPQLTKDLRDIEEVCAASLSPFKLKYLFEGVGYFLATIIISSTAYIKKINRNGVKKMTQNIFTLQQELLDISRPREPDLENAKQYFELLFSTPDGLLNSLIEQGPVEALKMQDYFNAIELLCRSEIPFDKNALDVRKRKLKEIIEDYKEKQAKK
eukprot:gene5499-6183_t